MASEILLLLFVFPQELRLHEEIDTVLVTNLYLRGTYNIWSIPCERYANTFNNVSLLLSAMSWLSNTN